jgi:hypothetical protein
MPDISANSSSAPSHTYAQVSGSPVSVFAGSGNLYGWLIEENSGEDLFLQVYDTTATTGPELDALTPVFVIRVKADQALGKDVNDTPYRHFLRGCVVRVSKQRNSLQAPDQPASLQFWFVKNPFA